MVGIHRSTMRLRPPPITAQETELRGWLRRFSTERPRWGWRRAAKMARRAGWKVNNKRIRRLWREEGLRVPQRRKKKRLTGIGVAVGAMSPIRPNVIWAMDFQFDTTADGRTLKMLNVIDEFTREALAIDVLDHLALQRGAPTYVRLDNGPEFVAHAVSDWCRFNSAGSLFIDPGTDTLTSYGVAHRELLPSVTHRRSKYLNNRAENSHQPTRIRERLMKRFASPGQAQRFLFAFSHIRQHFRPCRLISAPQWRTEMTNRFGVWHEITAAAAA